jgi:hypothetical protein
MSIKNLLQVLMLMNAPSLIWTAACPEATFPIILGGYSGHTEIYAFDYSLSGLRIAVGGATWDKELRRYIDYFE